MALSKTTLHNMLIALAGAAASALDYLYQAVAQVDPASVFGGGEVALAVGAGVAFLLKGIVWAKGKLGSF